MDFSGFCRNRDALIRALRKFFEKCGGAYIIFVGNPSNPRNLHLDCSPHFFDLFTDLDDAFEVAIKEYFKPLLQGFEEFMHLSVEYIFNDPSVKSLQKLTQLDGPGGQSSTVGKDQSRWKNEIEKLLPKLEVHGHPFVLLQVGPDGSAIKHAFPRHEGGTDVFQADFWDYAERCMLQPVHQLPFLALEAFKPSTSIPQRSTGTRAGPTTVGTPAIDPYAEDYCEGFTIAAGSLFPPNTAKWLQFGMANDPKIFSLQPVHEDPGRKILVLPDVRCSATNGQFFMSAVPVQVSRIVLNCWVAVRIYCTVGVINCLFFFGFCSDNTLQ